MDRMELQALQTRLQRVEQRLRVAYLGWLISIVVIGVLGLGVQQASSQSPPLSDVLKVRGIEVVDTAGTVRIGLTVSQDGTSEVMLSEAGGKPRMWLTVRPDGTPGLIVADSMGKGRIWLTAYPDRSSGLILSDASGKGRIWIGALSDGTSNLVLVDPAGRVIFQAR